MALSAVFLALSQTPFYHGFEAGASHGVPAYIQAFAYPRKDKHDELT